MPTRIWFESCLLVLCIQQLGASSLLEYDLPGNLAGTTNSPPSAPVIMAQPLDQLVKLYETASFTVILTAGRTRGNFSISETLPRRREGILMWMVSRTVVK